MSAAIGSVKLGASSGEMFLGRDMGHGRDYSDELAQQVDKEVRTLIENAHDEAYQLIIENRAVLDRLATALLEKETLDQNELADIFRTSRSCRRGPSGCPATSGRSPTCPPSRSRTRRPRSTRAPLTADRLGRRRRAEAQARTAHQAAAGDRLTIAALAGSSIPPGCRNRPIDGATGRIGLCDARALR